MATAMTPTTGPAVLGTVVIVVETRRTSNIAKSASARTALSRRRAVAPAVRKAANLSSTKTTETVTIKTTTVGAIGMEVTAAVRRTVAQSKPSIARNASARTRIMQAAASAQAVVNPRNSKAMATVMTPTTIAAAPMMAVIAVLQPSRRMAN